MPKISVIVPVYKVEKYLRRCVDSILNQTYTDFECILVDDGSPDGCPAICDEYAQKDKRVRVIHKENGGLSDARNAALEIYNGDYVFCVDSDDYIHPKALELLYKAIKETGAGYVSCKEIKTGSTAESYPSIEYNSDSVEVFNSEDIFSDFNNRFLWLIGPYAWGKLYSKRCFRNLRYDTSMKLYEDEYIFLDLVEAAETVAVMDEKLYYYFQSDNSLMRDTVSDRFILTLKSLQHLIDFMNRKKIYKEAEILEFKWIMAYMDLYYRICDENPDLMPELKKHKSEFNKKYPACFKNAKATRAYKLMLILFRINPKLARKLYFKLQG